MPTGELAFVGAAGFPWGHARGGPPIDVVAGVRSASRDPGETAGVHAGANSVTSGVAAMLAPATGGAERWLE
jgi:hypothetical protein